MRWTNIKTGIQVINAIYLTCENQVSNNKNHVWENSDLHCENYFITRQNDIVPSNFLYISSPVSSTWSTGSTPKWMSQQYHNP